VLAEKIGKGDIQQFYCPDDGMWLSVEDNMQTEERYKPSGPAELDTQGDMTFEDFDSYDMWRCTYCEGNWHTDDAEYRQAVIWRCGRCQETYDGDDAEEDAVNCCK